MFDPKDPTETICHDFVHMRGQLLAQIIPYRSSKDLEIAGISVTSLILENKSVIGYLLSDAILTLFYKDGSVIMEINLKSRGEIQS